MRTNFTRVLMLVENNPVTRDIRVFQEATALSEAGHQVSVISPGDRSQPWRETINGINVFRYPAPSSGEGFLGYLWEYGYSLLAMYLLSFIVLVKPGFDVIHSANPPDTMVFIAAFYKLLGKRFIFDHHDLAPEIYLIRFGNQGIVHQLVYKVLLFLERFSCKTANTIIATNLSFKSIEMERDSAPEEKIMVVRNGPALDHLKLVTPSSEIQQKEKVAIVYLGVIGFQDGVDYLLRSLSHLSERFGKNNYICYVGGSGDALPSMKLKAQELNLCETVIFSGWIDKADVPKYISNADICVAPEPANELNNRSTIIKIMEYMALGKPIVAFDLPEHRATAQDAALYAEPNKEIDFARKIATLMDDPTKRYKMGRIGQNRIREHLAWDFQKERLLSVYDRLA
jgi:glycosyltransferase involved in cell wall biosynthesis